VEKTKKEGAFYGVRRYLCCKGFAVGGGEGCEKGDVGWLHCM
jgi:hypothetical protein